MRLQVVYGILLIFTQAVTGLLLQNPAACIFIENNPCFVALGQRLNLQMPQEEKFKLRMMDTTSRPIINYDQSRPNSQLPSDWQFVTANKMMILTSAKKNNSGTYTLDVFIPASGNIKSIYTFQLSVEAEVSSVKVSYSCLSPGVPTVSCSAEGENLRYTLTSDTHTQPQLVNGKHTVTLNEDFAGTVTCRVENHVSRDHSTTELQPCSEPTTTSYFSSGQFTKGFMVFVTVWLFEVIILLSLPLGAFYIYTRIYKKLKIADGQEAL